MSFCWTTIEVRDMEESLEFYQQLVGLELNERFFAGETMELAFLGDGQTQVELIADDEAEDIKYSDHISLGFKVESLDEKLKEIEEKGLEIHSGPFQPNPSIRFFFMLDPNGLKIQFVEDIAF